MVRFIYLDNDNYDTDREKVLSAVTDIVATLIQLPNSIEIEFKTLINSYGELILDPKFKNRIRLDKNLNVKESILPLIHELIHLNQLYTGRLKSNRQNIIWENKVYHVDFTNLNYEKWCNFPWEQDVVLKQQKLLDKVINLGLSKI